MANKRQHRRFIKRCEVEFVADGLTYRGISSDFSLKGLFIRTKNPLAPGTVFDLVIHLPDGAISRVKVRARRAWKTSTGRVMGTPVKASKNGMGAEVLEKDANYLHLIRSLLSEKSSPECRICSPI
jgi:hypothetical protein